MQVKYYQNLRREIEACEHDRTPGRYLSHLKEALDGGDLKPADFSLRELFIHTVPDGRELIETFNPRHGGSQMLLEAGGAVKTSDFANITGQITFTAVLEKYNDPAFIGEQLVTVIQTSYSGEKLPGIGRLGDKAEVVPESQPYPFAGVSEEWVETPVTTKRGFIVPVTKEAVYFDKTGMVLERCGEVGYWLGVNREKRILDAALGISTLYRKNGAAAAATYGDTPYDNLAASNALVDFTDVQAAELLWDGMTDPLTGEPIMIGGNLTMVVPTALKHTAFSIANATQVTLQAGGFATTGNLYSTSGPRPQQQFTVLSSPWVKSRTSSASTWFIGDFKRAFAYMQNWPIAVVQAPSNSEMEFTHDIVSRFRASEMGAAAVREPRYVIKNTA